MTENRLDVGFVPVECPGSTRTGATHTSSLLIEHLSRRHDLTVYVSSQRQADPSALPAKNRVDYVLHDDLAWLPHPIPEKQDALASDSQAMEEHDLIHSYSSAFIPVLADLDVPTLVTLNSYLALCPKADLRYHGRKNCTGPRPVKCATCVPATGINRRQGLTEELKSGYFSMGRFPLVWRSMARANDIDGYQALSPHVREDYARHGFDPDRISVIPHFYDEQFLAPGPKEPGAPVSLLYVGALQDIKGVNVLIDALPSLIDRGISFELRIVGSGAQGDRLRRQAVNLGVNDRIEWMGRVEYESLPPLYRDADLFIYPGLLNEPFGRVMLEAMASRIPIVCSDIGSMDHIVGPAGELFDSGNASDLASAVERVLDNYGEYRGFIDEQLEQYRPDQVIDQFDDLYWRIASKEPNGNNRLATDGPVGYAK